MGYVGFGKLESKIAAKGGVRNPGAVAADIGREKYGKKKFQKAAAAGKSLRGAKPAHNTPDHTKVTGPRTAAERESYNSGSALSGIRSASKSYF